MTLLHLHQRQHFLIPRRAVAMGNQNSTERPNKHDETDITSESSTDTGEELTLPENSRVSASPRPPTAAPAANPSGTPVNSTPALKRSQSIPKGRAKYGNDERSEPKPKKMVTSLQMPETRKVARKRQEQQEPTGRRHEEAVTAHVKNRLPSSSHHQQRPDFSVKVPVVSGKALGPYGPTNPWNGDQSGSRPYRPTNSVNFLNGGESENAEETDATPRKRLDEDRLKHADETVVNRKTPVRLDRKQSLKAKRSPGTPKKYSRQLAGKTEKAAGSSLVLFPGLVKYMGPSGFGEDLGAEGAVKTEGLIKTQGSQDDETVAILHTSSNGGKPRKSRDSGEPSSKTTAKVLGQTSAVSGKAQKPQGDNINKPKNAIDTSAPDLAGLSTPPAKAKVPKNEESPAVDDGIRRSGRARKVRQWDGENYEVRPSKQARRILD